MTIRELENKNGYVRYNGKNYVLIRQAFIYGDIYVPRFEAPAIVPNDGPDRDGCYPVYRIEWACREEWLYSDRDDEGEACDWEEPYDITSTPCGYDIFEDRIL